MNEERRVAVIGAAAAVKFYVAAVLIFATITMILVACLAYFLPGSGSPIATIVGIATPILVSLLSGGLYRMAIALDGKLSRFVQVTEEKARAEGKLEGIKEAKDLSPGK